MNDEIKCEFLTNFFMKVDLYDRVGFGSISFKRRYYYCNSVNDQEFQTASTLSECIEANPFFIFEPSITVFNQWVVIKVGDKMREDVKKMLTINDSK